MPFFRGLLISFAVDELATAKKFYGETLGIDVFDQQRILALRFPDDVTVFVYPKPDHTPATFTVLNFPVDDIDQPVDELAAHGVPMERYEDFNQDKRGVVRGEDQSIAWFTDPAGNVLSVVQQH